VPQVVEAEVLDAGALLRQAPGGGALLDAFTSEGEAPARVLSPRRFERRHGIRIHGNAAAVTRLRRAVIEPGHLPVKIHAAPFEPQDLARTAAGRERKLHNRLHVVWQRLDQSVNFLRQEFRAGHRYAFVLRTDKPHPHVQAVVKALSEHGTRLHIKKPILRRWRLEFARHLREQHIAANATERVLRGQIRVSKPPALYHIERRGVSIRRHARAESVMDALGRRGLRTERGKSKLVQTRGVIERRWRAIQHALTRRGMTDLAEEVLRFVGEMPPPMTDREQLARDLSSGRSRPREITPLFSR
jgi:hypothetical protein